ACRYTDPGTDSHPCRDRLVSIAAVYREVDPDDRRKVRVHPSPRDGTRCTPACR
ncbi:hypothetical protein GS937_20450, partial [Rhodococcus hoagii]|nr:hypothetical protein [Prescottella equi]